MAAYGEQNLVALQESGLKGRHVYLKMVPMIVVTVSPCWRVVIRSALVQINGVGELKTIYRMVERLAPDKTKSNRHYREKVRQVLQLHHDRISKGKYKLKCTSI